MRERAGAQRRAEAVEVIDPLEDFPWNVGDYLVECRERGLTFDEAWTVDLDRAAREAEWTWTQLPYTVETTLAFAKRHLRAAYEGRDTPRYCAEDCGYLALEGDYCILHSDQGEGKAA